MALSMMVEKESGKMEGNDFENLWSRVAQRDGRVRYVSLASWSSVPMKKLTAFFTQVQKRSDRLDASGCTTTVLRWTSC